MSLFNETCFDITQQRSQRHRMQLLVNYQA
jgi:hypothetical protein